MKKIITALIMAAILFCLPLSAEEEPVYLPNYGAAYWRYANPDTLQGARYFEWPIGVPIYLAQANVVARSHPAFYYEIDHEKNATYHIKLWYDISNITNLTIYDIFQNDIFNFTWWIDNQLGYAENNTNSYGKPYSDMITSTMDINGNTVTYDIYYNTSEGYLDNIPFGLAYFAIGYKCGINFESENVLITASHVQVEAWYDKDAEIYENILNQIAANQEIIIDNQGNIINYGSGNELPSGGSQFSQVESQLSSAEEAVLNKSSNLKESVANDWNNQKSDAREFVNTIAPSTQVLLTVYNDFVSVLPDNVKILFVVLPLLIFIGWLVGRIN